MNTVAYIRNTSCLSGEERLAVSLEEQEAHIKKYTGGRGLSVTRTYCDSAQEGENREAFDRLMGDGMNREYDLVVADSVFLFGPDFWQSKELLLHTFFPAGISFAIVEDDFFSQGKELQEVEAYWKEKEALYRSNQGKAAIRNRTQKGILSRNDVAYGYELTEEGQLAVKEETAEVVRKIFGWYLEGVDLNEIAARLEEQRIPNPNAMRGVVRKGTDPCHWIRRTVKDILGRSVYCGHWKKVIEGEEIELSSPALVESKDFDNVQELLKAGSRKSHTSKEKHRYSGLLVDPSFGQVFRFRDDKDGINYCAYNRKELSQSCPRKKLLTSEIDEAVWEGLQKARSLAEKLQREIQSQGRERYRQYEEETRQELKAASAALAESEKKRMDAYRQWQRGALPDEEYNRTRAEALEVRRKVNQQFEAAKKSLADMKLALSTENPWIRLFFHYKVPQTLTRDVLEGCIQSIVVEELTVTQVILKESDWFRLLPLEWRQEIESE